jgi:hypothetical protein
MDANPESFQIFADEIVNSSMLKSRDLTKKILKIPKGNPNPYIEEYFIEKDRTNIPERTRIFILKEFKNRHWLSGYDIYA